MKLSLFCLLVITIACTKDDEHHIITKPPAEEVKEADSTYASLQELVSDTEKYVDVEDMLSQERWNIVESNVYGIIHPQDTVYHELQETDSYWEFIFRQIGFPWDSLVGGDLKRSSDFGYSTTQFQYEPDFLAVARDTFFFGNATRYRDSSCSFQLKKTTIVNDSIYRVVHRKLQSAKKPQ